MSEDELFDELETPSEPSDQAIKGFVHPLPPSPPPSSEEADASTDENLEK